MTTTPSASSGLVTCRRTPVHQVAELDHVALLCVAADAALACPPAP